MMLLLAAATHFMPPIDPGPSRVELAVPRSELKLENRNSDAPPPAVGRVALRLTSWAPDNLYLSSLTKDVSAVTAQSLPGISVAMNLGRGWTYEDDLRIIPSVSLSYRGFERSGTLHAKSFTQTVTSSAPLFSVGTGLEIWDRRLALTWLRPYVGLGLRSHALVFTASALDLGGTRWGYSGQGTLGTEFTPWGPNSVAFDLSGTFDVGQMDGKHLQALALQGGLQWSF